MLDRARSLRLVALGLVALSLLPFAACSTPAPTLEDASLADAGSHDAAVVADAATPTDDASAADGASATDGGTGGLHILFVGNSYTYANDLPGLVRDVIASAPDAPPVTIESVAVGGATLADHYYATGALERIRSGTFSHVVLQGQSVEPLLSPETFLKAGALLGLEARLRGAEPVYFETWARAPGDAVYQETWSGGGPTAMQEGLRDAYLLVAQQGSGTVAPVGDAWERALGLTPPPILHDTDRSHPTPSGSYLAACVFYRRLIGRSALGLGAVPAGVAAEEAALLQQVADALTLP